MPKLIDRVPENRFIALFVGRSGTGKTVAELSFAKPLHVNDFDLRIGGGQVSWLDMNGITYDPWPPRQAALIPELNKKLESLLAQSKLAGYTDLLPKTYVTDSITNMTYAFICQSIPLTHRPGDAKDGKKGKWIGPVAAPGPEDYGLEANASYDYVSFLKTLPLTNVILSAHYIDVFGKADPDDPYSANVVIGKKLSIRDKIGENILTHMDHVFEFEREINKYFVRFRGELARTAYEWLPDGRVEWTKKNFYELMMSFKPKS